MKSDYIKYGIYFALAALFVLLLQFYFPNPINWKRNFNTQSKDPYGLYVFNRELPQLLSGQKLERTALSPYEFLTTNEEISAEETTFLMIENHRSFDETSFKSVLEKVKNGADLVIANEQLHGNYYNLLDSLELKRYNIHTNKLYFVHKGFSKDTLEIRDTYHNIFQVKKPENHQVIAKFDNDLSFISTKYGKGTVYLSTTPILLTNYYLLNEKNDFSSFAEGFASVLHKKHIVWFDANHPGFVPDDQSILRVLFKHKSLRFAWYTLMLGLILYVIFYGKRKQRIVPLTEPVKNTSVEYIETVGNLYFQENNHTQLIDKQIKYTLYFIRSEWHIPTQTIDEEFRKRLQQKTQAEEQIIKEFTDFIHHFDLQRKYSQNDLLHFNQLLEKLNIDYGTFRK